jgi:hypothetical protein
MKGSHDGGWRHARARDCRPSTLPLAGLGRSRSQPDEQGQQHNQQGGVRRLLSWALASLVPPLAVLLPLALRQDIQDMAFPINGPLAIMVLPLNRDTDLIQIPRVS